MKATLVFSLAMLAMTIGVSADTIIEKDPDFGPWWNPLGNGGTYVYADCFIAPAGDTQVTSLGMWLEPLGGEPYPEGNTGIAGIQSPGDKAQGGNSVLRFQVWGDAGGPNWAQVIATTEEFSTETAGLNFYSLPVNAGGSLVPGTKYWFVGTGVGMGNPALGAYRVGGHTQNSDYNDNCTFWYSNDPSGQNFDGQNLTPEMAFQVVLSSGPTPSQVVTWGRIKSLYP